MRTEHYFMLALWVTLGGIAWFAVSQMKTLRQEESEKAALDKEKEAREERERERDRIRKSRLRFGRGKREAALQSCHSRKG